MRFSKILAVLIFALALGSNAYAGPPATPELDPSIMGSAFLLISGAALILRAQLAKK